MNKFCPNLSLPESKALIDKIGLSNFYIEYIRNNYNIPPMEYIESIPEYKTIDYSFNAIELLNSKRGRDIFSKGQKNNWAISKVLDEIGGFGKKTGYKALFGDINRPVKDLSVEELSMDIATNYSYIIEINTAKEPKNYDNITQGFQEVFDYNNDQYFYDEWDGYFKNGEKITKKEFQEAKQKSVSERPTQHYSNLTVPGGTNYTENEIATPAITPSIKGHAQFATDNGIGWFRSDDKTVDELKGDWIKSESELPNEFIYNGERYFKQDGEWQTKNKFIEDIETVIWRYNMSLGNERIQNRPDVKTRRILEVQSDLFQKGRDKKDLVNKESENGYETSFSRGNRNYFSDSYRGEYWYNENGKNTFISLEEYQKAQNTFVNTNENQFLQLLNKDNNWVTFFVKSIIQDSAKKGYEKVLFPLGDTASKIEGHETLEDFKRQKEDRIKELEEGIKSDNKALEESRTMSQAMFIADGIENKEIEIKQLKQEIEQVETEGIASLKPIYNFYQNTVSNILKKQGYNPVEITDEYGNRWNEITLESIEDQRVYLNMDSPEGASIEDMLFINKELFDAHQQNSIKNSIIAQIRGYITDQSSDNILTTKDIRDTVFADFEIARDMFLDSSDVEEQEIGRNLANVVDNFDRFWDLANADLSKLGINQSPITGIQTDNGADITEAAYDSEDAIFQKLNYSDESSFQQSSKDTASAHMKLALSMIPKYEYEDGKVVTYEGDNGEILPLESRNLIGMVEFEPLDVIWNDLLYTMVDVPRGAKIDYLKNSDNPRHNAVYELLEGNQKLQNEFEVTFSKQQARFITAVARRPKAIKTYNKQTGSWENTLDEHGNVIYENRSISILDTNRSNPENLLVADWNNNFLTTSLVIKDVNGNLFVDVEKGAKLKEHFEKALEDWDIPLMVRVFKTMGIDISKEALSSTGLYIERKLTSPKQILTEHGKFIFDRLAGQLSLPTDIDSEGVIESSLEDNNPFLQESRAIDLLARLENKVNPGFFESSFISGDGKAKYSFVNNTYATHQYSKLINSPEYLQKLKTTPYASGSHWLNQLLNNPTFKAHFDFRYVDTLGNDANNQTNKPFGKMNTKEKEYFRMSIFQNGGQTVSNDAGSPFVGYTIGLTPSDKTTLPIFKTVMVKVNTNENLVINKGALEVLRNQFISEYNRVKTTIEQNDNESIIKLDKYHGKNGMGTKFIMFPSMNKLMFDSEGNLLDLDDNRIKNIVNPELIKMAQGLIKDQIDYWTELGLYNTQVIDKSYAKKVKLNANNGETILRNLAANYAINNFIAMMNQTQLFSGDPALHGKPVIIDGDFVQGNSIENTWINYFKRMAKDIAPGLDPNFDKSTLSFDLGNPDLDTSKHFNTIFLKDLKYSSAHLSEYRKIIGDKVDQGGSYAKINPADAQEYTTLREHLVVMKALGKLSPEQEAAGERLIKGGTSESDISLILQPMKPVYVEGKIEDNINKIYYIKTSSFPLIPALTKGLEIDKLRVAMEDNNIQRAVYESGVKLGIQGALTEVSTDGGLTFKNLNISPNQIINLPRTGFRIQQEIPYHGEDNMVNEGSQGRKLVLNNVLDSDIVNYNGLDITGAEAKRIFETLHIEKMNRAFDAFKEDIGVDEATGRINNLDKLAEILRKEAEDRDYPLNDIYSVSIVEEEGVQKFKIPLSFTQSAQRFESILNSIVTNRVIKGELPGFTLVQGSGVGFKRILSDENLTDYSTEITWVNPNDTQLNYIREKNGKLSSADILVPNYLRDNEGNLININDYIVGGYLATDSIPEELLTIIGVRIPTQGLNSMMKFRVKGFLPTYMGDLAIVPAEVTSQMGSDFDVDKLFFYNYHHSRDKEGNLRKITADMQLVEVDNPLSAEAVNSFVEANFDMDSLPDSYVLINPLVRWNTDSLIQHLKGIVDGSVNLGISSPRTTEELRETVKDIVVKLTTGEFNLGTHQEVDTNFNKLSAKQIDNLIVQMFEDRLSDVNAYADIIEPNGFGLLPEVSKTVSDINKKSSTSYHTFTTREQNSIYEVNSDGKLGTALFSLASTFFKSAQDSKLSLVDGASFRFKNNKGEIVELNNLYEIENIEGGKRSNVIMYLQSAAVDNAKEQILGNLNINEFTMNVASTMAMLGLTEDFIGYFMSQPVIREFTSVMANKSDIIDGGELSYSTASDILRDLIRSKVKDKTPEGVTSMLDTIIYSADNLKTLLEYKAEDANTEYLPEGVADNIQDLKEYVSDIFELKILMDFENLLDLSNEIRTLQSAINPDTKGLGTSFASIESKTIQIQNLLNRAYKGNIGILDSGGVLELLLGNTTSAKAINILTETRDIYSQVNLYSGNVYSSVLKPLMEGVGLAPTESNLRDIYNNFRSYLLSSGDFINTEDVDALRENLLFGENNIAVRWDKYSKTPKGRKNILTKRIKSKIARNAEDYNGLTANNTPASSNTQDINNATMYFYDMINSSDAVEKQLAEDIVRYFILTGANFGPSSVGKYINFDILEKYQFGKKARKLSDNFNQGIVDNLEGFKDQYFQNNPFKAKSVELSEFKTSFEISRTTEEIMVEGVPATHLVAYDSSEAKPRLYKRISVSEDSTNIVYSELEVKGNKLIKRYNFNAEPELLDITRDLETLQLPVKSSEPKEADTRSNIIASNYNLNTGDFREVLTRIATISQVPEYKQLANTLLRNTPDNFSVVLLNEVITGNGSYTRSTNTIKINTESIAGFTNYNDKFEQVFLEELVHALTVNNLVSQEGLDSKQITARNKIVRLYQEYIDNFVNKDDLKRYRELLSKSPEARTAEEIAFLRAHLNDLYPMTSVEEFVGQGLTKPEFRETLKNNNFWTRLVDLIKSLLGIDVQSDLDFLFTSTLELISTNPDNTKYGTTAEEVLLNAGAKKTSRGMLKVDGQHYYLDTSKWATVEKPYGNDLFIYPTGEGTPEIYIGSDTNGDRNFISTTPNVFENIDNFNEFANNEYNRLKFVEQRDKFLANWNVKDYWKNPHKKYTAETQRRFLTANGRPDYDRIRIEFWNNELRIRRVDPILAPNDTLFNIDEEARPKSREDKFIDRILTKYENTVKRLEDRLRTTSSEAEKGRLSVQLENTKKKLEELKLDRNLIKIVDSIGRRLRGIEKLLDVDNPNYHELFEAFDYVKEIITLNQEIEFDTGSEIGAKYKKKADNLAGKASGMLNKLKDKSAQMVQDWATTEIDWAVAPNVMGILSEGVREVNSMEAGNLDATQSSNQHIQALQYLIDYSQTKADTRHSEFMAELAEIEAEYRKDYGSSYNQLYQLDENGKPTKYLLNKYLDEYYKATAKNYKAWKANTRISLTEEGLKAFEEARKAVREVSNDQEYLNWLKDNDPNQYVKDFESGKKYDFWRPARKYVDIRPIDRWIDPRYTELMNRPDTDSAKRLYQFIEPLFRRLNNKYNSGQVNYVPELKKDTIKYFTEGNLKGGISRLWEDFSNDIRSDVYITGATAQSDLDPLTREPRKRIPVRFFGDNLETIDRSTDLARIAEIVMYQEESNKVKHEIEPLLNIYYTLLRDAKQNKGFDPETGDAVIIDKPASKTSEQASFIIEGWLYGLYRSTEEAEQKYGKATDAIINYVRLKGMAYNPFSAIGNVMQGVMSNFTFAGGGQFFGQNDFLKASMVMNKTLIGSTATAKKVSKAFMYFDAFVRHNEMNHGQSRELRSARSKYSRWFEPMGLQQSGEYYVQGQTMMGILFKTKVKNLKGEYKPVWEAFDNNFNWNTKEFGENPYEDPKKLFNLKMRIRKAIIDVHGNYTRPIMNKKHFYWRLVYTFRTWLPQAITNRFGSERTDILLGDTTKGRYRSYPALWKNEAGQLDWQSLRQNVAWLLKLGSKNTLSEVDMQNLRKNLSELIILATITAALMLLRAGMDDWDEETKELWTYAYNNLMRARGDVMFFMDPKAAQTILRDPIAAMSVVNDFLDVLDAGFDTIMGDPVYKAGPRKGQYRLFKETVDNIPFINQIPKNIQYMDQVFISR